MFLLISRQILKMFVMLCVGYGCVKIGILDHNGTKAFSNVLLLVVNPLLMIDAFQMEYSPELNRGLFIAGILAVAAHVIAILSSMIFVHGKDNPNAGIERFGCIYSNCGFMGIPLVQSILGSQGVLFLGAYSIVFTVCVWTHGLIQITGNTTAKQVREGLLSPALIGTFLGAIFYFARVTLPVDVADTIGYLTGMNTPVAMIVAGATLAEANLPEILINRAIYKIAFVKLIIVPVVLTGLILVMHPASVPALTILVCAACPVATTGTLMALRYDKNYKYSSEIFSLTTVLSLVTIPLMVLFAETIGAV